MQSVSMFSGNARSGRLVMGEKPMRFSLPDETSDLSWHLYACSTGRPLSLSNSAAVQAIPPRAGRAMLRVNRGRPSATSAAGFLTFSRRSTGWHKCSGGGEMGKRSTFERREADFYPTPRAAVVSLKLPTIQEGTAWKANLPAVLGKTRRTE